MARGPTHTTGRKSWFLRPAMQLCPTCSTCCLPCCSRICLSAIHAGAITNTGGQFTLYYAKGRTSYTGRLMGMIVCWLSASA